jgi:hypothetical protein
MEHDRNFKNLFVDYSRESLALFAGAEACAIDATTRITPIRQEQGVERLGERHRELDVPLLAELRAVDYLDSPNIVARLTLPTMAFAPEDKLKVIAAATRGLTELEPALNRRLKYPDFIDIYAMLTDDERER